MKAHCLYCDTQLMFARSSYGMRCMCHDEHRFLKKEDVLSGFHKDKVYLLDDGTDKMYDNQADLQKRVPNG
jgi:hypothetical protein